MKDNTLDLHGVRHVDVSREVDKFIGYHLMNGSRSVIIITGNSNEMKQLVGKTLTDYSINYIESWYNTGELSVSLT